MKTREALKKLNVARPICDALLGRKHSQAHRIMVGVAIMILGVAVGKLFQHACSHEALLTLGDALAGAIHGLGLTPVLEAIAAKFEDE